MTILRLSSGRSPWKIHRPVSDSSTNVCLKFSIDFRDEFSLEEKASDVDKDKKIKRWNVAIPFHV